MTDEWRDGGEKTWRRRDGAWKNPTERTLDDLSCYIRIVYFDCSVRMKTIMDIMKIDLSYFGCRRVVLFILSRGAQIDRGKKNKLLWLRIIRAMWLFWMPTAHVISTRLIRLFQVPGRIEVNRWPDQVEVLSRVNPC